MALRKIVEQGDECLTKVCRPVTEFNSRLHELLDDMVETLADANGAGLAALTPAWMTFVMDRDVMRFAQFAVRVFGCEMDFACPENTAREGIERLRVFFRSIGMPTTFAEIGARAEDIPAMAAHRAEKPNGFPFGSFAKIGPEDMEAILRLAAR